MTTELETCDECGRDFRVRDTGEDLDEVRCPDCTRPPVTLVGADGNAFNVLGLCRRAARKAGWTQERIDRVTAEMTAGDYDHLLATALRHFDVS